MLKWPGNTFFIIARVWQIEHRACCQPRPNWWLHVFRHKRLRQLPRTRSSKAFQKLRSKLVLHSCLTGGINSGQAWPSDTGFARLTSSCSNVAMVDTLQNIWWTYESSWFFMFTKGLPSRAHPMSAVASTFPGHKQC